MRLLPLRPVPLVLLASGLASALAALAGCSEPEAPGCATDVDCPAGRVCKSDGTCGAPPQGGGGSGGDPGVDACGSSTDCRDGPFSVVPSLYWDGTLDGSEPVCTVPIRSCPAGDRCEVATICAAAPDGATRPGGMRCERDEQCGSGRCLSIADGVSICLRSCAGDGDCPLASQRPPDDPFEPTGLSCGRVEEGGIGIDLCVPLDPAQPTRTLCANDCQCSPSDDCAASPPGLRCRFDGDQQVPLRAVPLCEEVGDPAALRPTLSRCPLDAEECLGGGCVDPCQDYNPAAGNFCEEAGNERCSQPCSADRDCPPRTACATGYWNERVGDWMAAGQGADIPGREVRYCQLPLEGCFDEVDCCPFPDGAGGCLGGWAPDRRRCTVVLAAPANRPRLLTRCLPPDPGAGLAAPGSCCAGHEGCDSNLCVPARAGTPCAGGGVCSVPCDPDPAGLPGPADDRDRCARADFGASDYHRGSSCLPFTYRTPFTDEAGEAAELVVELAACQ